MNVNLLDKISSECPREYLEFLLWHYRVVDAFWFIRVEEKWDLSTAEMVNERVWGKCTELAARRIKENFVSENGLAGFRRALEYLPWTILVGYVLEERSEELILSVPHCPPQEARIKRGIGEYACKAMHMAEFEAFARVIDPRIRVECLFAPPDEHPDELFCKWRFTVLPREG